MLDVEIIDSRNSLVCQCVPEGQTLSQSKVCAEMKLPQAYTVVCMGVNIRTQKQNRMTDKYIYSERYMCNNNASFNQALLSSTKVHKLTLPIDNTMTQLT